MELLFNIQNQVMTRTDSQAVIGDSKNYLTARFTFSSDWTGINEYLKTAIDTNKTYLGLTAPTTGEQRTQINRLTKQMIRVERLLLNQLDTQE